MRVIGTLIMVTALAGVAGTGLGGLIGAMLQKDSKRVVSLLLSFAGGVMLSVVCFDLVTEAIETEMGVGTVVAAIALGVGITYLLNCVPSQLEWKIGLAWANTRGSLNSPS